MAVLCQACGQSMTAAEVTQRPYDGVAGNWHRDCAYLEYLADTVVGSSDPWITTLLCNKQKLTDKKNSVGTDFP